MRKADLSRKGGSSPSFIDSSYEVAPKRKWPTRFSRIGHSPAPARHGSRNHIAGLPCPVLSALPRIISYETLENSRQRNQRVNVIYVKFLLSQGSIDEKIPLWALGSSGLRRIASLKEVTAFSYSPTLENLMPCLRKVSAWFTDCWL